LDGWVIGYIKATIFEMLSGYG